MDFLPKNYYHDGISTGGIEDFLSGQILVPWELGFGNDCTIRNLSSGILYIYYVLNGWTRKHQLTYYFGGTWSRFTIYWNVWWPINFCCHKQQQQYEMLRYAGHRFSKHDGEQAPLFETGLWEPSIKMIQNDRNFPYIPLVLGIYVVKDSWNPSNPSKYEEFHGFEIVPLSYAKSTVSINEFDNFDLLCISLPRVSHRFLLQLGSNLDTSCHKWHSPRKHCVWEALQSLSREDLPALKLRSTGDATKFQLFDDFHPNSATHQAMGMNLAELLEDKLKGWSNFPTQQ